MKSHRDLPSGSQAWADEVDRLMQKVADMERVILQMASMLRIDPTRPNLNVNDQEDSPSAVSAVKQKLSGLSDVNTYNVAHDGVLSYDKDQQAWVTNNNVPVFRLLDGAFDDDTTYYSPDTMAFGTWDDTDSGVALYYSDTDNSTGIMTKENTSSKGIFKRAMVNTYPGATSSFAKAYQPGRSGWASVFVDGIGRVIISARTNKGGSDTADYGTIAFDAARGVILPTVISSARPAGVAVGTCMFDRTLNKPVFFSTGGNWRDAAGNAV